MSQKRPNILLIMSDDHGQWAANCYGCRELHTPVMDHLARTGMRMDRCFTPTPVCSPARANLFTGKISSQHGIHDFLAGRDGVDPSHTAVDVAPRSITNLDAEVTLPEILRNSGYHCALSGKWHMGNGHLPQKGFDRWFSVRHPQGEHSGVYGYSDEGTDVPLEGFKTEILTDRALQFMNDWAQNRTDEEPLFLYVGYIGTHGPWRGHPERLVEAYRSSEFPSIPSEPLHPWTNVLYQNIGNRESLAQYYASVTHIDENIGRLVDRLESLGLRDDTLVVYTSDHGLACGHHGVWGKGNCTTPKNMLETSIRVPMIANHPGLIPSGRSSDAIVDHCDTFLTLLDWAGVTLPDDERLANLPGQSYAPLLRGEPLDWEHLYFGEYGATRCIRSPEYKYVHRYGMEDHSELYDLVQDPDERRNLVSHAAFAAVRAQLLERLESFFSHYEVPERSGLHFGHVFDGITADGTPKPEKRTPPPRATV